MDSIRERPRRNAAKPKGRAPCLFPDCGKPNFARGYCAGHAKQIRLGQELRPLRSPRPDAAEGYHWCSHCKQFRPEEDFGWDITRNSAKRLCLPCTSERQVEWRAKNKGEVNLKQRLKARGLSRETYDSMLATQKGRCAICSTQAEDLHIDHDHKTGAVRGLLCALCNRGIGQLRDDPEILRAAVIYLEAGGVG